MLKHVPTNSGYFHCRINLVCRGHPVCRLFDPTPKSRDASIDPVGEGGLFYLCCGNNPIGTRLTASEKADMLKHVPTNSGYFHCRINLVCRGRPVCRLFDPTPKSRDASIDPAG